MIDLDALRKATLGDQTAKIAVKRAWLTEVLAQLEELQSIKESRQRVDELSEMVGKLYKQSRPGPH